MTKPTHRLSVNCMGYDPDEVADQLRKGLSWMYVFLQNPHSVHNIMAYPTAVHRIKGGVEVDAVFIEGPGKLGGTPELDVLVGRRLLELQLWGWKGAGGRLTVENLILERRAESRKPKKEESEESMTTAVIVLDATNQEAQAAGAYHAPEAVVAELAQPYGGDVRVFPGIVAIRFDGIGNKALEAKAQEILDNLRKSDRVIVAGACLVLWGPAELVAAWDDPGKLPDKLRVKNTQAEPEGGG